MCGFICNVTAIFVQQHVKYLFNDMEVDNWLTCMHTSMVTCVDALINTCMHICMHTYIYILMDLCLYIYIQTPIHTLYYVCLHTFLHTYAWVIQTKQTLRCVYLCTYMYTFFLETYIILELGISTILDFQLFWKFPDFQNFHTSGNTEIWK